MKKLLIILTLFISATFLYAQNAEETETVIASGYGATERSSLNEALLSAVEQTVGTLISSTTITANQAVIDDEIYAKKAGFVTSYEIISVKKENDLIKTIINAQVSKVAISQSLKDNKIATYEVADPNANFAQVMTKSIGINESKRFIKNLITASVPKNADPYFIKILNFKFDEGKATETHVPYLVLIEIQVDKLQYQNAIDKVVNTATNLTGATFTQSLGKVDQIKERTPAIIWQRMPQIPALDKKKLYIVHKYGQTFHIGALAPTAAYVDFMYELFYSNELFPDFAKQVFEVNFNNSLGVPVVKESISFFNPTANKLFLYLDTDGVWLDNNKNRINGIIRGEIDKNGVWSTSLTNSGNKDRFPTITPFFDVMINNNSFTMNSLTIGIHGTIEIEKLKEIRKIDILLKK